jgi:crossover junction endodeoxyribonuclease RuvC
VLRAPRRSDVPARLAFMQAEMEQLLRCLRPDVVVVEEAFAGRNVQSALRIGEGRGVVLACAARSAATVVQYPPAVAQKVVAGNGRADKTQVARMVAADLKLDTLPSTLDASDALALALAYVRRSALDERAGRKKERHA